MRLFREELLLTITRGIGMVVMLEVVRHIPRLLIMQETLHPPSIHYMLMLQTVLHNLLQQTKLLPNIMMKGYGKSLLIKNKKLYLINFLSGRIIPIHSIRVHKLITPYLPLQ